MDINRANLECTVLFGSLLNLKTSSYLRTGEIDANRRSSYVCLEQNDDVRIARIKITENTQELDIFCLEQRCHFVWISYDGYTL